MEYAIRINIFKFLKTSHNNCQNHITKTGSYSYLLVKIVLSYIGTYEPPPLRFVNYDNRLLDFVYISVVSLIRID